MIPLNIGRRPVDPAGALFARLRLSVFAGIKKLQSQDVLIAGAETATVSPTGARGPADALELTGAGPSLLPGLVDNYALLFSAGEKNGPTPRCAECPGCYWV